MHRLLPPSTIAGVSVICAGGAWLFAEPMLLRGLVAAAAVPTVVGAVLMRRWDRVAGKRVAELERSLKSEEWRNEERIAELESDLEESREVRTRIEQKLRAKRAELAALRGEHAALLRRYANAETERASALEGSRRLALEAARPAKALAAAPVVTPPAGSTLFREANAALDLLAGGGRPALTSSAANGSAASGRAANGPAANGPAGGNRPARTGSSGPKALEAGTGTGTGSSGGGGFSAFGAERSLRTTRPKVPGQGGVPEEGEAAGNAGAAGEQPRTAAAAPRHFTVPAAAAIAPPAPAPRKELTGGFDFFGTKTPGATPSPAVLEAAQNSDLADVVGDEALAVHKAESESRYRPADSARRAVGQVIDLTAHDDTEPIDVKALRTAAS
ncbi:hypothetical protein [Streptomyces sp. NA04227]|uniref:hypothetical protein n=1 Tax=Streptomyces sp. NA04227 TaxID=2742136 RepID=UPI0020CA37F4|nr:hypothetical protein [Streptomyces sp. NA04227]